ncbi:MAG: hypothetical protein AAGE84_08280 [Cyanobacteria bacterium P01_G01_bin.39]
MEIVEKITLITSVLWVIWSMLSLRNAVVEGEGIFPASITSVLLLIIGIVTILIFHLSPLHLIWIFVLSFPLGLLAVMTPIGQQLGMGVLALFSLTRTEDTEFSEVEENPRIEKRANKQKDTEKRGFGN